MVEEMVIIDLFAKLTNTDEDVSAVTGVRGIQQIDLASGPVSAFLSTNGSAKLVNLLANIGIYPQAWLWRLIVFLIC
jgi:hypothetical protein